MRAFILVILSLFLGVSGNQQLANQLQLGTANVSQTLQVALAQGRMIENVDTHGGFHGDGQSLAVWKFDDNSMLEQIQTDSDWKELPLTDNLEELLYGVVYDNGMSITEIGPCVDFSEEQLPRIQNGYYYFVDRQAEAEAQHSDAQIMERPALNFSVALYDTDMGTLYYIEVDT
ncbi:MAG: hypothetical protein MR443_01355 [Lachnospiraceae bacterium]|nr:hypothetical protein [Lachnospiraceae bacterium]